MSWTDERIATLKKMWEGGSTASQIADELGGVSRNAVIGKAHRLGLKSRPSPVKANDKKKAAKKVSSKSAPAKKAAPAPAKPAAMNKRRLSSCTIRPPLNADRKRPHRKFPGHLNRHCPGSSVRG